MEARSDHLDFSSTGPLELGGLAFRFPQQQTTPLKSSDQPTRQKVLVPQQQQPTPNPLDTMLLAGHRLAAHVEEEVVMAAKADGSIRCEVKGNVSLVASRCNRALLTPPASVVSCVVRLANVPSDKTAVTLTDSKTVNVKRRIEENTPSNGNECLSYSVLLETQAAASSMPPCAIHYTLFPEKRLKIAAPQFKCEVDSRGGRTIVSFNIRVLFHPLLGGCSAKRLQVQAALAALPIASSKQLRLQPSGSYNEKTKVASWIFDDYVFAAKTTDQGLVLQCLVAVDGPAPPALPQSAPIIVRAGGCELKPGSPLLSGAEVSLLCSDGGTAEVVTARTATFDVRFL